jgi:hypothetical protein
MYCLRARRCWDCEAPTTATDILSIGYLFDPYLPSLRAVLWVRREHKALAGDSEIGCPASLRFRATSKLLASGQFQIPHCDAFTCALASGLRRLGDSGILREPLMMTPQQFHMRGIFSQVPQAEHNA